MTDEAPVDIPDLCADCGGAGIATDSTECSGCDGYGMVLITDDGPDELEEDEE